MLLDFFLFSFCLFCVCCLSLSPHCLSPPVALAVDAATHGQRRGNPAGRAGNRRKQTRPDFSPAAAEAALILSLSRRPQLDILCLLLLPQRLASSILSCNNRQTTRTLSPSVGNDGKDPSAKRGEPLHDCPSSFPLISSSSCSSGIGGRSERGVRCCFFLKAKLYSR